MILNRGTVFVGTTYDTPSFAVDCIETWWQKEGRILQEGKPNEVLKKPKNDFVRKFLG